MGRLLPGRKSVSIGPRDDPQVLCLDDDRTRQVLSTLSSDTSQAIFSTLNEKPMAPRDVAETLDMSVQNVVYHLENLEEAGLIDVLDTCYSEKGQEMRIYGPTREPYVVFLGLSEDQPGLRSAFKHLSNAIGPAAIVLALGQSIAHLLGDETA